MMRKFLVLSIILWGVIVVPMVSACPPIHPPHKVVRLSRSAHPKILRAKRRLSRTFVPGYGPLFKSIDREMWINDGKFDLNIHPIIALHENIYPKDKKNILPAGLSDLKRLEDRVPDFITDAKYQAGWSNAPAGVRIFLFESALPAYLISAPEEELFIPSAVQLENMLDYYRHILRGVGVRGVFPSDYFAQQMSAVSNLGLLGNAEDAEYILHVAQTDFGSSDVFKDLFITRALLSLGAYRELQIFANMRLTQKDHNKELQDVSLVWQGVQKIVHKHGKQLAIPQERIRMSPDSFPDILQKEIIAHHPFNYILGNPSLDVTEDWLDLRAGIQEQFARAYTKETGETMHEELAREVTRQVSLQTNLPQPDITRPAPETVPVPEEEVIAEEDQIPEIVPLEPAPEANFSTTLPTVVKVRKPRTVKAKAPRKASSKTTNKSVTSPTDQQEFANSKAAHVLAELNQHISFYHALPLTTSSLRKRARYAVQKGNPNDPAVHELAQLLAENLYHKRRTASNVREELETYINTNHSLPVSNTPIRRRAEQVRATGDPNDPDVQAVIALLTQYAIQGKRDPANLRLDLENYLREHNGAYPPVKDPMMQAIPRVLRENKTSQDEDVQVLRELWQQHLAHVREAARQRIKLTNPGQFTQVAKRALSNKQLHEGILKYMAENGGNIPQQHHPLRASAEYRLGLGPTQDVDLLAIQHIFEIKKKKVTQRTPAQVRQEFETYLRDHDNQMPPHGGGLDQAIKSMIKKYPDDPDTKQIKAWVEQHRQRKSVSPQIRSAKDLFNDLTAYLTTATYSPHKGALYQAIHKIMRKDTPLTPDEIDLVNLWKNHRLKVGRSPEQVHRELVEYVAQGHEKFTAGTPLYHAARALLRTGDLADEHVRGVAEIWKQYGLKMPTRE